MSIGGERAARKALVQSMLQQLMTGQVRMKAETVMRNAGTRRRRNAE